MHEMSLAIELMDRVLDEAQRAGLSSVTRVEVSIGALQAVEPELLVEAFHAAAEGGPAEGAELKYVLEEAAARCRACGWEYAPSFTDYICPSCGQADAEVLRGRDLLLKSLSGEAPD
jgi:hydrogenase nickel incorporation protein HypA/HybF